MSAATALLPDYGDDEPCTLLFPCGSRHCSRCALDADPDYTQPTWTSATEPNLSTVWCAPCAGPRDVVETFDDQVGVEEQARDVRVRSLDCGHDEVTPIRRATGRCPHVDAPDACDCAPVIP